MDKKEIICLAADILSLVITILWPAIKTYVSLEHQTRRGRWAQYWMGLSFVIVIYYNTRFFLKSFDKFPYFEVVLALLLSFNNGYLLLKINQYLIAPLYQRFAIQLIGIFDIILDPVRRLLDPVLDVFAPNF